MRCSLKVWLHPRAVCMLLACVPISSFAAVFSYPSFPTSEWLLMLFATWLAQSRRLAPPSVSAYIAAVRSWHIDLGSPDPTRGASRLARLLRGIGRSRSSPTLIRLPTTNRLMGVRFSPLPPRQLPTRCFGLPAAPPSSAFFESVSSLVLVSSSPLAI